MPAGGVAAPIGAIIGAGTPANGQTLAGVSPEALPRSGSLTAQASSSADIRPRWVVFDFATGIKTIELADGSFHEELFEAEPVAQLALSTLPHAASDLFDPGGDGKRGGSAVASAIAPLSARASTPRTGSLGLEHRTS